QREAALVEVEVDDLDRAAMRGDVGTDPVESALDAAEDLFHRDPLVRGAHPAAVPRCTNARAASSTWRCTASRSPAIATPAALVCPPPPIVRARAATSTVPTERNDTFTRPPETLRKRIARRTPFTARACS